MRAQDVAFLRLVAFLIGTSAVTGEKFSINDQVLQIFSIVENTTHDIHGVELTLGPSAFNYLVPFTTVVTCDDGNMHVSGMFHVHPQESYMEAINETHSYLQARFAVADLSYNYEICWLNFGVPVPIWLRGKLLNSHYFVTAFLTYKPKCHVDIQRAEIVAYDKMTVNLFKWMPGAIGDWLLDTVTRHAQDRIFATVEMSIRRNAVALSSTYNPCVVFPSMGKMPPYVDVPEEPDQVENDPGLLEGQRIADLLDLADTQDQAEIDDVSTHPSHIEPIANIDEDHTIGIAKNDEF